MSKKLILTGGGAFGGSQKNRKEIKIFRRRLFLQHQVRKE